VGGWYSRPHLVYFQSDVFIFHPLFSASSFYNHLISAVINLCSSSYRAMLCIGRTMPSLDGRPSVRPSVCPSVTRRHSVETVTHILILFPQLGSNTILVLHKAIDRIFVRGGRIALLLPFPPSPSQPLPSPPLPFPSTPPLLFPPPSWGPLPHYQLWGLGERCKLPQRGPDFWAFLRLRNVSGGSNFASWCLFVRIFIN